MSRSVRSSMVVRLGAAALASLAALLLASSATAQSATVSPDRPGFSNGASTTPSGRFQLEGGLDAGIGSANSSITPLNLLGRIGLNGTAELRIGATPITIDQLSPSASVSYLSSASLGAKFSTMLSDSVEIGVLPSFSGSNLASDASAGLGVDGLLGVGGLGPASLTFNVGVSDLAQFGGGGGITDQLAFTGAAALGLSATDTLGFFIEPYAQVPLGGGSRVALDGGLTWRATRKLQLDAWGDVTLNQNNALAFGAGATYLF